MIFKGVFDKGIRGGRCVLGVPIENRKMSKNAGNQCRQESAPRLLQLHAVSAAIRAYTYVQQCLDELVGEVFTTDPFLRSTLTAPSIAFFLSAVMCRSNLTLRGFSSKNELPSASSAQGAKGYFMLVNNPIKHGSFRARALIYDDNLAFQYYY